MKAKLILKPPARSFSKACGLVQVKSPASLKPELRMQRMSCASKLDFLQDINADMTAWIFSGTASS